MPKCGNVPSGWVKIGDNKTCTGLQMNAFSIQTRRSTLQISVDCFSLTGVDLIDGELFYVKTILNVLQVVFRVTVRRASLTRLELFISCFCWCWCCCCCCCVSVCVCVCVCVCVWGGVCVGG